MDVHALKVVFPVLARKPFARPHVDLFHTAKMSAKYLEFLEENIDFACIAFLRSGRALA